LPVLGKKPSTHQLDGDRSERADKPGSLLARLPNLAGGVPLDAFVADGSAEHPLQDDEDSSHRGGADARTFELRAEGLDHHGCDVA
jgi:hypothetical protein